MNDAMIRSVYERGAGILRLIPAFVTMNFNQAGGRLHLHPDDWFPRGMAAGSVKERWLSSVLAPRVNKEDAGSAESTSAEGLSCVNLAETPAENVRCTLPEAIDVLGDRLLDAETLRRFGTFPIHAKFFDYNQPLFLHLHLDEDSAARLGQRGKPEAYYFPLQLNNHPGALPITFFGLAPDVTQEEFVRRLQTWQQTDFHITELSRGYRLAPGTGWYTPPGVLHAPGSLLTYEVQWNSASGAVFENMLTTSGEKYGFSINHSLPADQQDDWQAVLNLIDWPVNLDPLYRQHYFRPPLKIATGEAVEANYSEDWIVYGNPYFAAKELVVAPGKSAIISDPLPYGCVVVQGHGRIGPWDAEAPTLLRYGQPSADEFFVGVEAAQTGVRVGNTSRVEPLVLLKHFGPGYPNVP